MIGKTLRSEMYWTNRGKVALQSLQVSCLSDMHSRFYESSKLKKWMFELCTFLQIWSHISMLQPANNIKGFSRNGSLICKDFTIAQVNCERLFD